MKKWKNKIYEFVVKFKQVLMPVWMQEKLEDLFFLHCPITIIKLVTVEYSGYLKYYYPREGDVILDCGAWKGHFTVIASRLVGSTGKVIALEPQVRAFNKLCQRVKRLRLKNVIIKNCGAYNTETKIETEISLSSGFRVVDINMNAQNTPKQVILLRKLDDIAKEEKCTFVNFVKMDIEGAEIEAIDGMEKILLNNNVQLAIASYHLRNGNKTAKTVEEKLRLLGYKAFTEFPEHLTTYGCR